MGVRLPSVVSNAILNSPIVTTAETVICTTPAFSPSLDNSVVLLFGLCSINLAASTTAISLRLRRGTLVTSPQVQVQQYVIQSLASATQGCFCWYFDSPGVVGGQQYSLTAQLTGATANSAINDVALLAFAL